MPTRQELQQEFISLRNAQVKRPKEYEGKRVRDIYINHLIESDELAEIKSDDELVAAIKRMKQQ